MKNKTNNFKTNFVNGWKRFINYFNPKFVDINNQKVSKKFPWFYVLSMIIGSIAIIWMLAFLNPNLNYWDKFWTLIRGFFVGEELYHYGSVKINYVDTFLDSLTLLWKTITYSLLGTILGIIISVPLALLSSKNIVKKSYIYLPVRIIMSVLRAIPPLIFGYLFFNLVSKELTATLTIAIFVATIMTKWLYEDLDTFEISSYEGLQSIGNSKIMSFRKAVFPYLIRRIVSYGFYSFEMVVRFAAILAVIGISSIGTPLNDFSSLPDSWTHLSLVIWLMIGFMILIEVMNYIIRIYVLSNVQKHVVIDKSSSLKEQITQLRKQKSKIWILKLFIVLFIVGISIASLTNIEFSIVTNKVKLYYFKLSVQQFFNPNWDLFTKFNTGANVIQLGFSALFVSIVATFIGLFIALIFGVLASKNITGWFSLIFKFIIIVIRAIPAFTYAILFLFMVDGNREFTGALALGLHSVGMLGKLIYEGIEKIDKKIFESLDAVGASRWQKIWYGAIKSIMPQTISNGLYRIEINFKSIVVLGVVGASDFGYNMSSYSSNLNTWNYLSSYVIFTIILMLILEQISNIVRNKLMTGYFLNEKNPINKFLRNRKRIKALALAKFNNQKFENNKYAFDYQIAKEKHVLLFDKNIDRKEYHSQINGNIANIKSDLLNLKRQSIIEIDKGYKTYRKIKGVVVFDSTFKKIFHSLLRKIKFIIKFIPNRIERRKSINNVYETKVSNYFVSQAI